MDMKHTDETHPTDHRAGTSDHTAGQHSSVPSEIGELIDDISYLMDEADALAPLIGLVPFDEDPGDGYSIFRWLKLIDFAQTMSIEPLIRGRGQTIDEILHPAEIENVFDKRSDDHNGVLDSHEKERHIQALLKQIHENRARLTGLCNELSPAEWSLPVELYPHQTERLQDVVREWVRWERACLKKMADRVLVYQKEMHSRREIRQKRSSREGHGTPRN